MNKRENEPSNETISELASYLGERFIQRQDIYPMQTQQGYIAVKKPLEQSHLVSHLKGDITLGAYVLNPDSQGQVMVLDADDDPDWRRLKALAQVLDELGCVSYLEHSRRGGHLWLFFDQLQPASGIRLFGRGLLAYFGIEGIELFPKQDFLKSGPGSLIRLPFGVHRKSQRRYGFYKANGIPLAPTLREQILVLRDAETVTESIFSRFCEYATELQLKPRKQPPAWPLKTVSIDDESPLFEQVKSAIRVRDFIFRYVELSPSGMTICPFHDDQVASFSVNDQENYWHCFACDIGGSVIDFWMHWQGCEFSTAVDELADMLLIPNEIMASEEA